MIRFIGDVLGYALLWAGWLSAIGLLAVAFGG